jgi:hypothetical protein
MVASCDQHGAVLVDPVTQVEQFRGERIALERIITYQYPVEDLEAGNVLVEEDFVYAVGGIVAFQAGVLKHVLLGVIVAIREQGHSDNTKMESSQR